MRDHGVSQEISRADFDTNAIEAKDRRHCVDDLERKSTSILDRATISVSPLVEVADYASV
jgi:hypothetical protein